MQNKTLKLIVVFLFSLGLTSIQAQEAISASGGNATGSGSASYTIGQIVYTTITNSGSSVSQGVQQPYEISVVTGIEEARDINLIISVYPNPTTDFLVLKIINYDSENLSFWLYSINGILIKTDRVNTIETQISFGNKVSGTYFLKVTDKNKEIKTFKIIKN